MHSCSLYIQDALPPHPPPPTATVAATYMDGISIIGVPKPRAPSSAGLDLDGQDTTTSSDDPLREKEMVIATHPFSSQALQTMPDYWNIRVAFELNGSSYDYNLKLMRESSFSEDAVLERGGK